MFKFQKIAQFGEIYPLPLNAQVLATSSCERFLFSVIYENQSARIKVTPSLRHLIKVTVTAPLSVKYKLQTIFENYLMEEVE